MDSVPNLEQNQPNILSAIRRTKNRLRSEVPSSLFLKSEQLAG
jgi:hypothetical protein